MSAPVPLPPGLDGLPGLNAIVTAAARLNPPIDISGTLRQLAELVAAKPAEVRNGGRTLTDLASQLGTGQQDINQAAADVRVDWTGQGRAGFDQFHAGLSDDVAGAQTAAGQLAAYFDHAAGVMEGAIQAAVMATGSTGAALDMMSQQPQPPV